MIKKIVIILFVFFISLPAHAQEESKKIYLKFGKHKDFYRFVFTCDDIETTKSINAKLVNDGSNDGIIKLFFPLAFDFEFEGKTLSDKDNINGIQTEKKDKILIIKTTGVKEIKVFRLDNPPRLIVDAFFDEILKEEKVSKTVVLLDAGHGGKDTGLQFKESNEKDIALYISKETATRLTQKGIKVSLTRATDDDIAIEKRIKIESDLKPYILISIHVSNKEQFTVYASSIKKNLIKDDPSKVFFIENTAVKSFTTKISEKFSEPIYAEKLPVTILKEARSPALMIEIPKRTLTADKKYTEKIIDTFVQAIELTLKEKKKAK